MIDIEKRKERRRKEKEKKNSLVMFNEKCKTAD